MQQIRKQIDGIDKKVIQLLVKRMKLAVKLGRLKKKEGHLVLDKKREIEMLKNLEKQAKKGGLDVKFVNKLYKEIFKESRKVQKG
jgi:chorismate mutase